MDEKKIHIEKNTVQETLIIPLFARKICSDHFPQLFEDKQAKKICASLDYDFSSKEKLMNSQIGLFGALEVAQRHYDLMYEIKDYLNTHPKASVVNLGCGLDDTFSKVDNGLCKGYNIDLKDVIEIRKDFYGEMKSQTDISCDLNDYAWMDLVDKENGAVFFASGVFYYLKKEDVRNLFDQMAKSFPDGVLVFDVCNSRGAKAMTKTWIKEAGIKDVSPYFSLEDEGEMSGWSDYFESISSRSYMRGYRDIRKDVNFLHRVLIDLCDRFFKMRIVKICFKS